MTKLKLDEAFAGIEAQLAREDARHELTAQLLADETVGTEPHAETVRKYAPEGQYALTLDNGRPVKLDHPNLLVAGGTASYS